MTEDTRQKILDLSYDQIKELVASLGERPYRADQLLKWIFKQSAASYEEMSDLPQDFREKLIGRNGIIHYGTSGGENFI